MLKPIYNRQSWVLCECTVCGRVNYVEPHGTTAACVCTPRTWTEHTNIPQADRQYTVRGDVVPIRGGKVRRG